MACKNNEGVFTQGSDNFELWVVDGIFSCTVQIFYEFMLNGPPPPHTHIHSKSCIVSAALGIMPRTPTVCWVYREVPLHLVNCSDSG